MKVSVFADEESDGSGREPQGELASGSVSASFKWSEFDCNDGQKVPVKYQDNVRKVASQLEVLKRAAGGATITLNSGWRSKSWNKKQRGAAKSQHLVGKAADLNIAGKTPKQTHALILKLIKSGAMAQGGVGRYKTFVHYDVRGHAARWIKG